MNKALAGILIALALLAGAAGLSGREMADEQLQHIKDQWAQLQATPANRRTASDVMALRQEARGLAERYPGRDEIQAWERVVEQSTRHWYYYEDTPT